MSPGAVDRLLDALGSRLPEGARASWVAADGSTPATDPSRGQPHDPARVAQVADLLTGLAQLLRGADGPFADGTGRVLFESDDHLLLVHALGQHGMVAIDAGSGFNVALVRRTIDPLLREFVAEQRTAVAASTVAQHRRRAYRGTGAASTAALELLGRAPDVAGPAGRDPQSPVPGIAPAESEPPSLSAMPGEVAAPVLPPRPAPHPPPRRCGTSSPGRRLHRGCSCMRCRRPASGRTSRPRRPPRASAVPGPRSTDRPTPRPWGGCWRRSSTPPSRPGRSAR